MLPVWGTVNRPMVTSAKGTAMAFMKGMRRPPLKLLRSDQPAISGSVTASKTRPTARTRPKSVSLKRMGFWVMPEAKMPVLGFWASGLPV